MYPCAVAVVAAWALSLGALLYTVSELTAGQALTEHAHLRLTL